MPNVNYEEINPSLIINTSMTKVYVNGVNTLIRITPNEGYVLHDNYLDTEVWDPELNIPTEEIKLGFYSGTRSVRHDYDFDINPREFYAVLISEIPEGSEIYSLPNNNHEIM